MSDTESPEQILARKIDSLGYKVDSLQSDVRLNDLRNSLGSMDTLLNGLKPCIQDLREGGYVFGKGFEIRADGFISQWQGLRTRVLQEIDRQSPGLAQELRPLEAELAQVRTMNRSVAQPSADRLESELESMQSKVTAVESSIKNLFSGLENEANQFKSKLEGLQEMLTRFASATFRLLPTEGAVMAVKATFSRDEKMDKDDPQGFLFLTDQRLLFEQNQEVATKKVLFITTEKQKVQKLLFEVPVALVEQAQALKKGLFGHEDHLALTLKSGAPMYQAWLHLDGQDCNEWQSAIGKVRSGDIAGDRAVAVDQAQVEKAKAAPSKCPNCGAPVTQVVLRGMDSLTCEYCQFVIRL